MQIELPDELTPADVEFLVALSDGLVMARAKHPENARRRAGLYAEMGNVMDAVERIQQDHGSAHELAAGLRRLSEMACRLAVEGDASFPPDVQVQFPCIVSPELSISSIPSGSSGAMG